MPRRVTIQDNPKHRNTSGTADALAFLTDLSAEEPYPLNHLEPELIFVTEGTVRIEYLGGVIQTLPANSFFLAVPGALLSLTALAETTLFVARLRSERQLYDTLQLANLSFFRPEKEDKTFFLTFNENLRVYMQGFIHFLRQGFSSPRFHNAKIAELLYILRESYNKTDLASLFFPLLGPEVSFKNFVFSTVKNVGSVNELATIANMSVTGFRTKFQKIMGESPSGMINRIKADMVRQDLLHTDMPLKEISEKYGFNSIYVFTRFCTREFGAPPGNFRKSNRSKSG